MISKDKSKLSVKRPPRLKDVAELAGVSIMAVSVVVNGSKSTVGVSETTRERIQKALDELNYQPNMFARSLRLQSTGTVGFYNGVGFMNILDPFLRAIFHGIAFGLEANDQDILIYNGLYQDRHNLLIERVLNNKIDAVIVLPTPDDSVLIEALQKNSIPSVIIRERIPGLKSITADDTGGSQQLAQYLLEKGHKRILYRRSSTPYAFEALRYESFRTVIEQAGGKVVPCTALESMDSVTGEEEAIICSKSEADKITAVTCWRDHSASRLYDFCMAKGINVPGDLAIAGFDGIPDASIPAGLTTVVAHWDTVAFQSPKLINDILKGQDIPEITVIPADLHIGTTA